MPTQDPKPVEHFGSRDDLARAMIGRVVGEFEIRREIGRGGMGTVYEAWQQSLERTVAVKILAAPVGLTRVAIQRFQREAQAAAKLHHANIVRVYAQGEQDGIYYYAMELIHGKSIYELIEEVRSQRPSDELGVTETRVMDDSRGSLSDSASASWAAGSETVTLGRSDEGSNSGGGAGDPSTSTIDQFDTIARLTATVAEALEYAHRSGVIHRDVKPHNLILGNDGRLCISDFGLARVLEQPGVTMTGEFLGSPLYMSPEQLTGGSAQVDRRTDVYSLGATLYEWMTLRPPFPGQRRDQVISSILTDEPAAPRSLNSKIPVDLETICLKAIEKDKNHRYQAAAEMAADLRNYLERTAIKARRAGPIRRLGGAVMRHRVGVLLGVLALVILLFAGALYKQRRRTLRAGSATPLPRSVQQELDGAEPGGPSLPASAGTPGRQTADSSSPNAATTPLGPRGPATAPGLGQTVELETQRQAFEDLGRTLVQDIWGGSTGSEVGAELDAFERYVTGELANVLISIHAQALQDRLQTEGQPTQGADKDYLAAVSAPEPADALLMLDRALERDAQHYKARHLRAVMLCRLWRFDEMLAEAQRLVEQEPDSAQSHLLLAAAYLLADQAREALPELDHLRELAGDTPWVHTLRGLCLANKQIRDFGQAMSAYTRALELDPEHIVARFARGKAQFYLGIYDFALLEAEEVVKHLPESAEAYAFRAECYDKLGQYEPAIKDYAKAIELGGDRLRLTGKQLLAIANAEAAAERAGEGASEQPAEAHPPPTQLRPAVPRVGDGEGSVLDRILREWSTPGRPPPDSGSAGDDLPVP